MSKLLIAVLAESTDRGFCIFKTDEEEISWSCTNIIENLEMFFRPQDNYLVFQIGGLVVSRILSEYEGDKHILGHRCFVEFWMNGMLKEIEDAIKIWEESNSQ